MSKKRGLSLEDKRNVILSIYHNNKESYNLKEIETIGSKMGVVQQTIKDVNQSLVDDSLVHVDKIGSANFFWSFPSEYSENLKRKKINLETSLQSSSSTQTQLDTLKSTRCHPQRTFKLKRLHELQQLDKNYDQKLSELKAFDPEEMKRLHTQIIQNKESINRWTDNIWVCKKYLTKTKGISGKEADKFLKIGSNFDYV